jgi:Zn finger protein HypA/HybF involved in hydrogenase expression
MHEYAAVEALIAGLSGHLAARGVGRASLVRLRRSSAFDDAALRQAFAMLSPGTPLEGAAIDVTVENLGFACGCGHRQVITADDLIGHLFICPACGAAREIDHTDDLVVLAVTAEASAEENTMSEPATERSRGEQRCA